MAGMKIVGRRLELEGYVRSPEFSDVALRNGAEAAQESFDRLRRRLSNLEDSSPFTCSMIIDKPWDTERHWHAFAGFLLMPPVLLRDTGILSGTPPHLHANRRFSFINSFGLDIRDQMKRGLCPVQDPGRSISSFILDGRPSSDLGYEHNTPRAQSVNDFRTHPMPFIVKDISGQSRRLSIPHPRRPDAPVSPSSFA